jgi:hypothetical protein
MSFTPSKTPTQKFQYRKGMETRSGKNTSESHTEHLHSNTNLSSPQFKQQVMPKSMYINVAMQMAPKSQATNTASGTKA